MVLGTYTDVLLAVTNSIQAIALAAIAAWAARGHYIDKELARAAMEPATVAAVVAAAAAMTPAETGVDPHDGAEVHPAGPLA